MLVCPSRPDLHSLAVNLINEFPLSGEEKRTIEAAYTNHLVAANYGMTYDRWAID